MKKITIQAFVLTFSLFMLIGCSSKETKENALQYIKKMNEYVTSSEYKDFLKTCFKEGVGAGLTGSQVDEKKMTEMIDKKSDEIAKSMGFATSKELEAIVDKFKDDKDVKENMDKMVKNVNLAVEEITKEMTAKMQEQILKQADQLVQEGDQQKK